MAISAATVASDFNAAFRVPTMLDYVFERAARQSVVQQLVPQVPMGGNGVTIPVVTSRPSAAWVAEAAEKKKVSGAIDIKSMEPHKLACIVVVSAEVVRANPGGYVAQMRNSIGDSFAIAFDRAALHDEGDDGTASGGPFTTYLDQATKVSEIGAANAAAGGIHTDLVNAMSDIVTDTDSSGRRYRLTGWALDSVLEPALWGSLDSTGRPLYTALPTGDTADILASPGRIMGRNSWMGEGVASANLTGVVGYAGDFSQARWGAIGGISFSVSDVAAVTINSALVSLWEKNLIAIKAEAEYAFLVPDVDAFSKLTNIGNSPVTSS